MLKMVLSRVWSVLQQCNDFVVTPPKQWMLPEKADVLVYDACGVETLMPYLADYSVEILYLRRESINVPCFLRSIFELEFWRGRLVRAYADAYIRAVSPRVVLTFIDNTASFYEVSQRHPRVKTIFLQNGIRSEMGDIFGTLVPSAKYHVDYMLVFGTAIGKHYQKYVSGEVFAVGSIKNNKVPKHARSGKGTVLFVSQYMPKPINNEPVWRESDGSDIYWDEFYAVEEPVVRLLMEWCTQHGKMLQICARGDKECGQEYEFYSALLGTGPWQFVPRTDSLSSYRLVDAAEIVVFIESTLGYESLARGNKTASFSCRRILNGRARYEFGWPDKKPASGPFWTNELNESEFRRVLDYLHTVSDEEWERVRREYISDLMVFDPENLHFVALLKRLLSKPMAE
jgi:surface carbohydrate biosynthesis protein